MHKNIQQQWRWRQPNLTTKSQRTVTKSANNNNNKYIYRDFEKLFSFRNAFTVMLSVSFIFTAGACSHFIIIYCYYIFVFLFFFSLLFGRCFVWYGKAVATTLVHFSLRFGVIVAVFCDAFVHLLIHSNTMCSGGEMRVFQLLPGWWRRFHKKGNIENENPLYSK